MSHQMVSHLPDADMQAAPAALLRAAARAREIARQTQTGVVVVRNVNKPIGRLALQAYQPVYSPRQRHLIGDRDAHSRAERSHSGARRTD